MELFIPRPQYLDVSDEDAQKLLDFAQPGPGGDFVFYMDIAHKDLSGMNIKAKLRNIGSPHLSDEDAQRLLDFVFYKDDIARSRLVSRLHQMS